MDNNRQKKDREWLVLLVLLPFGVLCMFLVGMVAISQPPTWKVQADMNSMLDPYAYMTSAAPGQIEPVRDGIMTAPAWMGSFLTPQPDTSTGEPTSFVSPTPNGRATASPFATGTAIGTGTPAVTATASLIPSSTAFPTSTVYYPPPTNTKVKPPAPTNTSIPSADSADLSISKTDGSTTYTPGAGITYTIEVTNLGPDSASGFNITDNVPAAISGLTIDSCTTSGTASCGTSSLVGNTVSFTGASINAGGANKITITLSGTVDSGTTGTLSNTANIVIPGGASFTDPDTITNNSATDDSTQAVVVVPSADLSISKTDGSTTYTPGTGITYTIEVTNLGPDSASGFNITDSVPAAITGLTIDSCTTSGTASCGSSSLVGNTVSFTGASINAGGANKITITLSGTVGLGTTGTLSNTANIVIPGGASFTDPDTVNNSSTDQDSPGVDVQVIAVDDGESSYIAGDTRTYTVAILNASPVNLMGVSVTSSFPAQLSNWAWAGAPSNSADFSDSVNIPGGTILLYTVTTLTQGGGTLNMTVNATVPSGFVDTDPSNNSKTDSDQQIYSGNIGSEPDGSVSIISSVSSVTLAMTVNVNGHSGWDLIYYELSSGCGIAMDWVEIQVGDGSNWYTAFYWGNGIIDSNSNLAPLGLPETDNREICSADLYGSTGVAIELDGIVPAGSYPYVKILAPSGDADGIIEVDAVIPLPIP